MKILFYGTKDYDRLYFEPLSQEERYGFSIHYLTANLDPQTARLAHGYDAACIFVNADAGRRSLEELNRCGVRLLLLRCAGFNQVDLEAARELELTVLRVPNYSPEAVAEFAMALALAAERRIHKAYIKVRNNNFSLDGLLGRTLHGRTAGIVGTGQIGSAMARICHGFGMKVLGYDKYPDPKLESLLTYTDLDTLLRSSDLVSLHCPLTEESYHMLDASAMAQMKQDAILVNTSRGPLIDTDALLAALQQEHFLAVALDVYEDEDGQVFEDLSDQGLTNQKVALLLSYPNVIVTSHQAFFTHSALRAIAVTTLENALAWSKGLTLQNIVS